MKHCKACSKDLPLADFYLKRNGLKRAMYYTRCKKCYNRWTFENAKRRPKTQDQKQRRTAREYLKFYIRRGYVQKPTICADCKVNLPKHKIEGHHARGYSNPLDVDWLCRDCHGKRHAS